MKAFARELGLLVLEGCGHVDAILEAQEQRPGIGRQPAGEMISQRGKIERAVGDQRRHAGGALGARDGHAIDRRLGDAWERHQRLRDLRGRDVLALPAKGVADAIDEIIEATVVAAHQIAGAIPGVAGLEHVAEDFTLGVFCAGIALEFAAAMRCAVANSADRLADLVSSALRS